MSLDFIPVGARARGLSTRLFRRRELEALSAAADLPALARALARDPKLAAPLPEGARLSEVEAAVRRTSAAHLRTLTHWAGEDAAALAVIFADQDRRSLRALLRGALEGAGLEARLGSLVPTPTLPERALVELARQPTPRQVVSQLLWLSHPDAVRLVPLVGPAHPSLFALEVALAQGFAARTRAAAAAGDQNLRGFVARRLDLANAVIALQLPLAGGALDRARAEDRSPEAGARSVQPERSRGPLDRLGVSGGHQLPSRASQSRPSALDLRPLAGGAFLEGGQLLSRATFAEAQRAPTREAAERVLTEALSGTPLAELEAGALRDPVALERAALVLELELQRRAFGLDPLSSAALLLFALRLEAQARDLLRLAWGVALGAPVSYLRLNLVTPPWN